MSFRVRMFGVLVGLTALLVGISMLLVDRQFNRNTRVRIRKETGSAYEVFDRFQTSRLTSLITEAINVSNDQRLRGSLVTRDPATIGQAVEATHWTFPVDVLTLLDLHGTVMGVAGGGASNEMRFPELLFVRDALNGYDSGDLWIGSDGLFSLAAVPVYGGDARIGVLVIGRRLDDGFCREFEVLTGMHVALFAGGKVLASSLDENRFEGDPWLATGAWRFIEERKSELPSVPIVGSESGGGEANFFEFTLPGRHQNERCAGSAFLIRDGGGKPLAAALGFRSLEPERLLASRIQLGLLTVGGVVVLVSLVIAYLLARGLSRPIDQLVTSARQLAEGDLDTPVAPVKGGEFGVLSHALEDMRRSVKEAREELVRSERMSTIGRMASGIIHDIRQPMSAIYGYVDLMALSGDNPDLVKTLGEKLRRQLDRMLGMINELLDFARGDIKLAKTQVVLSQYLDDVVEVFANDARLKSITLQKQFNWDGSISVDRNRLQRGLENIIRNAVQAAPVGGKVQISTTLADGKVVIGIADDGPGIPEQIKARLFEPFFSYGKSQGTGLGLSVAQKVVQEHNGEIRVVSVEGHGTTIYVAVPAG